MDPLRIDITERTEGLLFWDGVLQIAFLSHNTSTGMHKVAFVADPLGWGEQETLSDDAARHLIAAYAHELRALKARRQ